MSIEKINSGSLAKSKKLNEVIARVNALSNMTVEKTSGDEQSKLVIADQNSVLFVALGSASNDFSEVDVILCQDGAPVNGKILFKET